MRDSAASKVKTISILKITLLLSILSFFYTLYFWAFSDDLRLGNIFPQI